MMFSTRSVLIGSLLGLGVLTSTVQAAVGSLAISGTRFEATAEAEAIRSAANSNDLSFVSRDNDSGPHSADGDARIANADLHFNAGRRFYFQNDLAGAKREFDQAVDALLGAPESLPDHRRIERHLEEICDVIYRFDIEKLGSGKTEEEAVVFDKAPIDEIGHMTFPVDPNLAKRLQLELNQTAAGIPLELAEPVMSYVRYFQTDRGRRILVSGLQRSGRYRAMIQRVFREEGVPEDLIYLAQAESGFLPRAVSNKKAVGMWQFIAGTGSLYQLNRTSVYDERLDPEKATRAAARYLRDLHSRYGDWYLALAAYNCGAGGVDRAVERTGYADYWELLNRHALPRETSAYVPIILAMTIMAKNPQDYGLDNIQMDEAVDYDTIQLTAPTSLNLIADATMQPISVMRELNPALLKTVAPVGFEVHVPKGSGEVVQSALESVPAVNRQAWRLHHVLAGDTLATIARNYHLTPDRIASVNPAADSISQGDVLLIPAVYHEEPAPRRMVVKSRRAVVSASSRKTRTVSAGTHIAAAHHLPAQVVHRKAAIHTASLQR